MLSDTCCFIHCAFVDLELLLIICNLKNRFCADFSVQEQDRVISFEVYLMPRSFYHLKHIAVRTTSASSVMWGGKWLSRDCYGLYVAVTVSTWRRRLLRTTRGIPISYISIIYIRIPGGKKHTKHEHTRGGMLLPL